MGQNPLVMVLAYYTTGYLTEVSCNFFLGGNFNPAFDRQVLLTSLVLKLSSSLIVSEHIERLLPCFHSFVA
jgi:hypothetical protein